MKRIIFLCLFLVVFLNKNSIAEDIKILLNEARILYVKGNHYEAFPKFKKIIQIDPNNVEAHLSIAGMYHSASHYEDALSEYKKVLLLDEKNGEAMFNMGSCYASLGNHPEALNWYKKAFPYVATKATEPYYRGDLAREYLANGNIKEAKKEIQNALNDNTIPIKIPENYLIAGKIARAEGNKDEALQHFKKCMELYKSQNASKDILDKIQKEIDSTK